MTCTNNRIPAASFSRGARAAFHTVHQCVLNQCPCAILPPLPKLVSAKANCTPIYLSLQTTDYPPPPFTLPTFASSWRTNLFFSSSALWPFVPMQLPLCTLLIGHLCTFTTFRIYYFRIRDPTMSHYPHRASAASQTELIYVCVWWFSAIHPPASQCTRPVSSQFRALPRPFGWRQSQWLSAAGCTAE